MFLRTFFIIFFVVGGVVAYAGTSEFHSMDKKFKEPYAYDSQHTVVKSYLDVINLCRSKPRKCGNKHYKAAAPLKWSDKLYRSAAEHARDMATHNLSNHQGSGKSTDVTGKQKGRRSQASERGKFHGYTYTKAFAFAENVGSGQKTLKEVAEHWMRSPYHCANIMNPLFREMAMAKGYNENTYYKTFWTLDLGYRR